MTVSFTRGTWSTYDGEVKCTPLISLSLGLLLATGLPSVAADAAGANPPKRTKAPKEVKAPKEGRSPREAKEAKMEAKEASKEKNAAEREKRGEKREEQRDQRVDRNAKMREARQERRIEDGIMHGYLTQDELSKLKGQQARIEALRKSFTADGKVTREEAGQLRAQLNDASAAIFAEKHDTQGKTKGIFGFGHSIALKQDVADRLGSGALSRQEARGFLSDFHELTYTKWRLSSEDMSAAERAKTQERYNFLLNTYFVPKT